MYVVGVVMLFVVMDVKFLGVFCDFFVLVVIGFGVNFLVRNRIFFILVFIVGVFVLGIYYKNILVFFFSVSVVEIIDIDLVENVELLVELFFNVKLDKFD